MNAVNKMEVQTEGNVEALEQLKKLREENARLIAEAEALKAKTKSVSFQVVEFRHKKTGELQRGINVHGITAKPMFFYGSQALKMAEVCEKLKEFAEANRATLSWK